MEQDDDRAAASNPVVNPDSIHLGTFFSEALRQATDRGDTCRNWAGVLRVSRHAGQSRYRDKHQQPGPQHSRRKARPPTDDRHQPAAVLQTTPDLAGVFGLERCDAHFSQRVDARITSLPQLRRTQLVRLHRELSDPLVAAKIALVTAGAIADVPGSPIPPGDSVLFTRWTSTTGASLMRSMR